MPRLFISLRPRRRGLIYSAVLALMRFAFIGKAMIDARHIARWMWALIDKDRRLQSGIRLRSRIVDAEDGYIDAAIDRDLSRHNFSAHKRRSGYNRRNAHGGKQRRAILTPNVMVPVPIRRGTRRGCGPPDGPRQDAIPLARWLVARGGRIFLVPASRVAHRPIDDAARISPRFSTRSNIEATNVAR
jgi:hypothetical protein